MYQKHTFLIITFNDIIKIDKNFRYRRFYQKLSNFDQLM